MTRYRFRRPMAAACAAIGVGCAVLLLSAGPVAAAESPIYRSIDKDGNVVFSDTPPATGRKAETVELGDPNVFRAEQHAPPPSSDRAWAWDMEAEDADPAAERDGAYAYRSLRVAAPGHDEPVRDNAGNVTIVADVDPPLRPGHRIELYLDGQYVRSQADPAFQLHELDRGTHTVQFQLLDASGTPILTSEPSTFHMLRYAPLLAPNRPAQ
jgi:hypothetical protein